MTYILTLVFFVIIIVQWLMYKSLKKKYKLFEVTLNKTAVGVSISDATKHDNPLIFINEGFSKMTGYSNEEVLYSNCRFLQGDETNRDTVASIRAAVKAGEPIHVELLNYHKNGTPFWNELTIDPIYKKDKLLHFIGIQRDITLRKKYEIELEKDLTIAKRLQTGLLSPPITNEQIQIEGYLEASSKLAGDMYFWYQLDEHRYAILISDVMGHGVASGQIANSIHIFSRRLILSGTKPTEVMEKLNEFMFTLFNDNNDHLYFFTAIYLVTQLSHQ